jgi:Mlc titration factor MtfA (ptsG expression regulator)
MYNLENEILSLTTQPRANQTTWLPALCKKEQEGRQKQVCMGVMTRWWRTRMLVRERERYDDADWAAAWAALPLLGGLESGQATRLADLALLFLRDKRLEPVGGLVLTNRMRLILALQACLPILELGLDWYRGWYAVILYPAEFVPGLEYVDQDGLVWVDDAVKSGEAWERGPVILSWSDVAAGGDLDGYNVVVHELAHKIDMREGGANGRPPLHAGMSGAAWSREFAAAFADLRRRVDAGEAPSLDPYGAESPGEFFAVVSEAFFEIPAPLHDQYPGVYAQLRAFYRQDPLARLGSPG